MKALAPARSASDEHRLFPGDSEMARRMRAFDWSSTALGQPAKWPAELRVALGICLGSRFPLHVWWGPELTLFYNDAYIPFLGTTKHPAVLGQSGRTAWAEIWHQIGPMIDRVFRDGVASWSEDIRMFFNRDLPREEVYITFSFSPVFTAAGKVAGMFCACTEVTEKIIAARQLETLRRLGVEAAVARSVEDASSASCEILGANPYDVPFAALYLIEDERRFARCAASTLRDRLGTGIAAQIRLNGSTPLSRLVAKVMRSRAGTEVADLPAIGITVISPPWLEECKKALVLPVAGSSQDDLVGVLLVGVSPRRPLHHDYKTFLDLVAGHVGTAISDARAYEDERRRAEVLTELDRSKTAFFSNISHEFRTPLTLLLGTLQDARQAHPSAGLEMAHRNALRLLRLVNSLLDFSRIEAGRIEAAYEPVDLAAETIDLAGVFRAAIEHARLRLVIDCRALSEPVYVDRSQWEKIVLNLLSNALKFTFEGEIGVSLHERQGCAVLGVRDTGVGIAPDEVDHVFERFYRIRDAHSRTHEGTGIGLSMVRDLVHLHGGEIQVESGLQQGTRFEVRIPFGKRHLPPEQIHVASAPHDHRFRDALADEVASWLQPGIDGPVAASRRVTQPDFASASAGVRSRVLVADDNADMRSYLERLLSPYHDVTCVADGQAALRCIEENPPDLVLSDVMMPRVDGIELLRRLRTNDATRTLPIILLSARAGEEARLEGLAAAADDYLCKPFTAAELLARVASTLRLAALRRELMQRIERDNSELIELNATRQQLLLRLAQVEDDERRRIARELHDSLGQYLVALRLAVKKARAPDHNGADEDWARVNSLIERVDVELDRIVHALRPPRLEDNGLESALRDHVDEWSRLTGIPVELALLQLDGHRFRPELEATAYRIVQEALNNVARHAGASSVRITLMRQTATLELCIEDDGHGFARVDGAPGGARFGLQGMRERVLGIGGELDIESSQGAGTTVLARLPLVGGVAGTSEAPTRSAQQA
jgi:signal transduction histidine kinase